MMKFEVYKGNNKEHYFRLVDNTGKILLSSEGYKQKESLLNGIETVRNNLPALTGVEKKATPQGKHFFNVKGANGQVVGTSTMFNTPELRDRWLKDLQNEVAQLGVEESVK